MTAGSAQKQQFSSTPLYSYPQQQQQQQHQQQQQQQQPQQPQQDATTSQPTTAASTQPTPGPQPTTSPFPAPDPSNQALYDFQWRVLSLCSEFYNAADELIVRFMLQTHRLLLNLIPKRNAPQHVLHQCFSLPGNQVDPITLLHEARKACDQLVGTCLPQLNSRSVVHGNKLDGKSRGSRPQGTAPTY